MDEDEPLPFVFSDELDLHPFAPRDIPDLVREWLDDRCAVGSRRLRLIHGKGIGVQRERTRSILAADPRVVSFSDAHLDRGGWGATLIELAAPASETR